VIEGVLHRTQTRGTRASLSQGVQSGMLVGDTVAVPNWAGDVLYLGEADVRGIIQWVYRTPHVPLG
jgi:hypothetical protein